MNYEPRKISSTENSEYLALFHKAANRVVLDEAERTRFNNLLTLKRARQRFDIQFNNMVKYN